jgi:hypothetical protein
VDRSFCPHRSVSTEGRIKCDKIEAGDKEVCPALCHHCPARTCDCQHLRFSLEKIALTPITVRWATGLIEVWDNEPPHISFLTSACSVKATPVVSPAECLACSLRLSWRTEVALHHPVPDASIPLSDNVLLFPRPPCKKPGLPRALASEEVPGVR